MAKKIINYKFSKQLIDHLENEEEEYDIKYTDYCINVTNNKGGDGTALLQEYYQILGQCKKLEEIEEEKQKKEEEEEKKRRRKTKSNSWTRTRLDSKYMFQNIINRKVGNANAKKRLKIQGMLPHLRKRSQEIKNGELSEHFEALHVLSEALEVVHNILAHLWTYSMNKYSLLQIANVFECPLSLD